VKKKKAKGTGHDLIGLALKICVMALVLVVFAYSFELTVAGLKEQAWWSGVALFGVPALCFWLFTVLCVKFGWLDLS